MQSSHSLQLCGDAASIGHFHDITLGLTQRERAEIEAGILPVYYPKGGMFFLEGQPALGVFLLRSGRAKKSISSSHGKSTIVTVAKTGDILGLAAVLTGVDHDHSVETLEPTHADYLSKAHLLSLMKISGVFSLMVTRQLSRNCMEAYSAIRFRSTSESVSERIARLLLQWAEDPMEEIQSTSLEVKIFVTYTHEEIGQFVGSSRETTTRTMGVFQRKKWIDVKGSVWTIKNINAIRRLASV
jgi:CRP/FNR family cyclic AMP-dependent transcriptional regulator